MAEKTLTRRDFIRKSTLLVADIGITFGTALPWYLKNKIFYHDFDDHTISLEFKTNEMVLVTAEYGIETLKIVYSSLNHKPGYIITNAYTPVSLTRFLASSPHHKVSYDFETGEIREKEPVEIIS